MPEVPTEDERGEQEAPPPALPSTAAIFSAVKSFVDTHGLVRFHINSYDHFLQHALPLIVSENSDICTTSSCGRYSYIAQWTNVVVMPPTTKESCGFERKLTPDVARARSLSYSASVVCDLVHDKFDNSTTPPTHVFRKVYRETVLARIPVMLGSAVCHLRHAAARQNECLFDGFGYFIVNGSEKTILSQEKLSTNCVFVFESRSPKFTYYAECRSCHELKLRSTSTILIHATAPSLGFPNLYVELPFIKTHVGLRSMFKLLGIDSLEEVLELVQADRDPLVEHTLRSIFEHDPQADMSRDEVLEWLGKATTETTRERRQKFLSHILSNECFPHMSLRMTAGAFRKKAHYLAHMVHRLLRVCHGAEPPDDRDDFKIKRIDGAGVMMSLLFRQHWRSFLRGVSITQARLVEKKTIDTCNFGDAVVQKRITAGFRYAFSTGSWGLKNRGGQTGVAQILSRQTTLSAISQLRRINTPISREGKMAKPRQLTTSAYGLVCPTETPEGHSCGLVKNLSILCHIRTGAPLTRPLAELILGLDEVLVTPLLQATGVQRRVDPAVVINGVIVGYVATAEARTLVDALRRRRRGQSLPFDLSIALEGNAVRVMSDPGAMLAPMVIASEAHRFEPAVLDCPPYECLWDRLLRRGIIEYLDKVEEANMKVALAVTDLSDAAAGYTHAHLHPSLALSVCASHIPFAEFNQSPRNTYQSAMSKQAVGFATTNVNHRMDTVSHVRMHAQRPLVMTATERMLGTGMATGENVVVAIQCFTGFNQEDSVIVSQSAVDRGLFRSFVYRTYKDEEKSVGVGADAEVFENPAQTPDVAGLRQGSYDKLDAASGAVELGQTLEAGDCIFGKTIATVDISSETQQSRRIVKRCKSTFLRNDEPCTVDALLSTTSRDGQRMMKLRTRAVRIIQIGDKVASRSGQKGVLGLVLRDDDMPRSDDGITPDLIMNPHAIPSRMTIGQLIEHILSRVSCEEGRLADATPFCGTDPEKIADALESHGFSRYGQTRMTCGITGEQLTQLVCLGPTFYQKLKHMVTDKIHARSRGPLAFLTRQPVEGRSREGGLRVGEMERDCVISHGAMAVMKDRLMECSDPFKAPVCNSCGLLCEPARDTVVGKKEARCRNCGSECTGVTEKAFPYAYKLFLQEMMGMHIAPRVRFEEGAHLRGNSSPPGHPDDFSPPDLWERGGGSDNTLSTLEQHLP